MKFGLVKDEKGRQVELSNATFSRLLISPERSVRKTAFHQYYEQFKGQGLVVAGFPANNFKSQEPGTNEEIQSFCTTNYGVKFPMFSKISVAGDDKHPLYKLLTTAQPKAISVAEVPFREKLKGYGIETNADHEVLWNFEKFVVGRNGEVVKRFSPDTLPDAPELVAAIEEELAK